jgi:hypothetical protein
MAPADGVTRGARGAPDRGAALGNVLGLMKAAACVAPDRIRLGQRHRFRIRPACPMRSAPLATIGVEAKLTAWWRCCKDCLASPGPCRQAFLASGRAADRRATGQRSPPLRARTIERSGRLPIVVHSSDDQHILGRETVDSASGPASPILTEYGRRVGNLGPGLTSDSADAASAVLRHDLSAGAQFSGTPPALPV